MVYTEIILIKKRVLSSLSQLSFGDTHNWKLMVLLALLAPS